MQSSTQGLGSRSINKSSAQSHSLSLRSDTINQQQIVQQLLTSPTEHQQHHLSTGSEKVAATKFTAKSQALMGDILRGASIAQTKQHKTPYVDRNLPATSSQVQGNLLLSEDQLHAFEKENREKPHERAFTAAEKKLIARLSDTKSSIQERERIAQTLEAER